MWGTLKAHSLIHKPATQQNRCAHGLEIITERGLHMVLLHMEDLG